MTLRFPQSISTLAFFILSSNLSFIDFSFAVLFPGPATLIHTYILKFFLRLLALVISRQHREFQYLAVAITGRCLRGKIDPIPLRCLLLPQSPPIPIHDQRSFAMIALLRRIVIVLASSFPITSSWVAYHSERSALAIVMRLLANL